MAVSRYFDENGNEFWKVYVHVRSTKIREKRIQRNLSKLSDKKIAIREEKRLFREALREMSLIDGKGILWSDLVHLWICDLREGLESNAGVKSISDYETMLRLWTKPWSKIPVEDILVGDCKELVRNLYTSGRSAAYQKKIKNTINRVFKWAAENRLLEKNIGSPMQGLSIQRKEEKIPEILSLSEIKTLLKEAKSNEHPWYPVWVLALNTGMRSGELYALRWAHVDLEKNLIMVHEAYDSYRRVIGSTKGKYWRVVPISSYLRSFLIDLKTEQVEVEYVLPRFKTWYHGDQVVPLRDFMKSIGLKSIKFHTLRACWATQMLASGVSSAIVMRIGGWKRSSTMDVYLRLAGVEVKGATECLDIIPQRINKGNILSLFGDDKT